MRREQLAHILRAACDVTGDPEILVIGSQSILASFSDEQLPDEATVSVEADIAFFDDPDERKSDEVDGSIGELSRFHERYGVYGQGVSITTAVLPRGWRDRLVIFDDPGASPSRALCLDPHDVVISKLVAGREKDYTFGRALIESELIDPGVLRERADLLDPTQRRKVTSWLEARSRRTG